MADTVRVLSGGLSTELEAAGFIIQVSDLCVLPIHYPITAPLYYTLLHGTYTDTYFML